MSQPAQPEITHSFGYWVRRQRLAMDMTQAGLTRSVNCATITIAKIERDERRPSRQMANLLADHLAIPEDQRARFIAVALGEKATDRLPLAATPLSPQSAAPLPTNLPTPSTPFVGRLAELQQLMSRLVDPTCRLLTLLGAGGFGKTRLALRLGELALAQPGMFPGGVFFVPLEGLENGTLVVPAIAAALDLTSYDQPAQESQLFAYLASKRLLLILDSAEEILEAGLVDRILAYASAVKIVVSTREALHLQQEWLYPIGGMGLDDESTTSPPSSPAADAITLFQQCALRARPDFDLARDLIHVQHICRLVEGAPLAIELAAAWLKVLSTAQIASELPRDIDFLATTHHNVPARHRSMRAVLEQSWRYLAIDEQRAFRRLSLFEGGFLLYAAQAVTGALLRDLSGLVDKSILQLDQDGRYRIHALLRQLGIQKLADDEEEYAQLRARHADYFLSFVATRTTAIVGPDQHAILRELQDDVDNIRTAWLHIAEHGTLSQLRGAMPVLFRFLWLRGRYEEGERLAAQSLAGANPALLEDEEQDVRIDLTAYHAQFAAILGADNQALSELHSALATAVGLAYRPQQAHCHFVLGQVQIHLGNANSAEASLWSAYHLYHALHDKLGVAETALQLGYALSILKSKPSLELFEESLALFRELGDRSGMADAMDRAAMLQVYTGELDIGEQLYRESLDIALAANNQLIIARSTAGLAAVAWIREQWDHAINLLRQHREIMQYLGHDNEVQSSLNMLCGVYADAGRYADAVSLLNTYPTMWRTPFTARAHIGYGAYTDVMRYLPYETADKLAADHEIDLSSYLLAWAMLLVSNCKLQRVDGFMAKRFLSAEEREGIALEILAVLPTHASSNLFTRVRARRLLTELHVMPSLDAAVTAATPQPLRSLQDLARDVLSIQLA